MTNTTWRAHLQVKKKTEQCCLVLLLGSSQYCAIPNFRYPTGCQTNPVDGSFSCRCRKCSILSSITVVLSNNGVILYIIIKQTQKRPERAHYTSDDRQQQGKNSWSSHIIFNNIYMFSKSRLCKTKFNNNTNRACLYSQRAKGGYLAAEQPQSVKLKVFSLCLVSEIFCLRV